VEKSEARQTELKEQNKIEKRPDPQQNRILRALPKDELDSLLANLEPVPLSYKQLLHKTNEPIASVYFPASGVGSLVSVMNDNTIVEVATVGREGMIGLPLFLGSDKMPMQTFIQIAGYGFQMKAESFKEAITRGKALVEALNLYTQALFNQIAQAAVCNRIHPIEKRCSRWLLMTRNRVDSEQFPLTQEFLSQMLGVRRATVNEAAGTLQKAGLITYTRGVITILDRAGLETTTCECYYLIEDEYNRLLGL
jgi:CRP-like cAMP-binding protein